jgi:hypothetical protein
VADRPFVIVDCEQGTPEWWSARLGRVTASEAHALLAKPRKGAEESVQRRDLRVRLALENVTGQPAGEMDAINSPDVRRGKELEPEARAMYEAHTGSLVQTVGMLHSKALPIGCSPDGIVGDFEGGLELKAPKPAVFLGYLRKPETFRAEYDAQILHSLFVSGLPWWDLCGYCPAMPEGSRLTIVRTYAKDVDLAAYELVVRTFLGEVAGEEQAIRDLVAREAA